jgi:hypothetical protein
VYSGIGSIAPLHSSSRMLTIISEIEGTGERLSLEQAFQVIRHLKSLLLTVRLAY